MSYFEQSAGPAIAPPRRRTASALAVILLLILGAVVGILASQGTSWLLWEGAGSATARHAGDGEAFRAREARFTADFPTRPDREVVKIPVGDIKLKMTQFVSQPTPDSAVGVAFMPLPKAVPFDLAGGIRGAAVATDSEILKKSKTKHQGYPAMTALSRSSIGVETRLMVVRKGRRAYFVMAVANDDPKRSFRTLVNSFKMD